MSENERAVSPGSGRGAVVNVRGEAQLEVPPDRATVVATVHGSGPTAARVQAELGQGQQQVLVAVDAAGEAVERHVTRHLHVSPVIDGRRRTISAYRGSVSTEIRLTGFDALGPLIAALGRVAQTQVDGPMWSLSPGHEAFRQVRIAAVDDARRRAADYAAAFGAEVGQLLEVSDVDPAQSQPFFAARGFRAGAESSRDLQIDVDPVPQTIVGQVLLRWELLPAGS